MTAAVIGVDPGAAGAVAHLAGDQLTIVDMPMLGNTLDPLALRDLLIDIGPVDRVAVEEVRPFRNSSPMGTFNFGGNYRALLAVLSVLERPVVHVRPVTWTRHHRVGNDKAAHCRRAAELFPASAAAFRGARGGLLDGRADAALIAAWAYHQLTGRQVA